MTYRPDLQHLPEFSRAVPPYSRTKYLPFVHHLVNVAPFHWWPVPVDPSDRRSPQLVGHRTYRRQLRQTLTNCLPYVDPSRPAGPMGRIEIVTSIPKNLGGGRIVAAPLTAFFARFVPLPLAPAPAPAPESESLTIP